MVLAVRLVEKSTSLADKTVSVPIISDSLIGADKNLLVFINTFIELISSFFIGILGVSRIGELKLKEFLEPLDISK